MNKSLEEERVKGEILVAENEVENVGRTSQAIPNSHSFSMPPKHPCTVIPSANMRLLPTSDVAVGLQPRDSARCYRSESSTQWIGRSMGTKRPGRPQGRMAKLAFGSGERGARKYFVEANAVRTFVVIQQVESVECQNERETKNASESPERLIHVSPDHQRPAPTHRPAHRNASLPLLVERNWGLLRDASMA